jgi:triosephosphate isomerase (TIM)
MDTKMPLLAANWKMYKTIAESVSFVETFQKQLGPLHDREVVIAPPFTALAAVRASVRQEGFRVAAQNCHYEEKGAFTGEISTSMLKDIGCEYVIIGHSERRHIFLETDDMVSRKVAAAYLSGLVPILCVGEKLDEREAGKTFEVIARQLDAVTQNLTGDEGARLVVAYEPVWAIGTGKTATPEQAQEAHAFIRDRCAASFEKRIANAVRIVYGGSVKPDNVDALMAKADVDGLLVGGASLEVESFQRIVQYRTQ